MHEQKKKGCARVPNQVVDHDSKRDENAVLAARFVRHALPVLPLDGHPSLESVCNAPNGMVGEECVFCVFCG